MSTDVDHLRALARVRGIALTDEEAAVVAEQLRATHESLQAASARLGDDLPEPATVFVPGT